MAQTPPDNPAAAASAGSEAAAPPSASTSASTGASTTAPAQKVELDLDDAPFLEDEEEEKKEEAAPEEQVSMGPAAPAAAAVSLSLFQRLLANKKTLFLAGAAFIVILAAAITVNILMGDSPPPPPPVEAPVIPTEQLPTGPPELPPAPVAKNMVSFEQFWVEQKDGEGSIRFLSLLFSIPTDNDMLATELNAKKVILRDALFYYLSRRRLVTIMDEANMTALRSDLMTVINEHVVNGKVDNIFIENYLVK